MDTHELPQLPLFYLLRGVVLSAAGESLFYRRVIEQSS